MTQGIFELLSKSLQHYSKRLTNLQEDKDVKRRNGKLWEDLQANSKKAQELTVSFF